jgi:dihydroorotate dehydrogenase (NAD+) catalytic subunit
MVETSSGMLNAIGLQNKGVDHFLAVDLPWLNRERVPVIASIAGNTVQEFMLVSDRLRGAPGVVGIEVNISCPNLEDRNNMFAHDPKAAAQVISAVRRGADVGIFAKLSPNVTHITQIAEAVLDAGATGLSLINTLVGMSIDIDTGKPRLSGTYGGLSGPAIKPVALKAVHECHEAFAEVPIIGMGGIMDERDAIEFVYAGATAVAIGTANFIDPRSTERIADGMKRFMVSKGITSLSQIRGGINA